MSESNRAPVEPIVHHGWRVVFAGLGINLALAIMYTWSVISSGVPVLAVGNGVGRIITGMISDKIGRTVTLLICFVVQAVLIFLLSQTREGSVLANAVVLATVSALIGANYGANLAIFPSLIKDYYGLKNLGMNYGLLFTAWGFGGFALALLAGRAYDETGNFNFAYYCSAVLLAVAAVTTFIVKPPHRADRAPVEECVSVV